MVKRKAKVKKKKMKKRAGPADRLAARVVELENRLDKPLVPDGEDITVVGARLYARITLSDYNAERDGRLAAEKKYAALEKLVGQAGELKRMAVRDDKNVRVPGPPDGPLEIPVWRFADREWVEAKAVREAYGKCVVCPLDSGEGYAQPPMPLRDPVTDEPSPAAKALQAALAATIKGKAEEAKEEKGE